MRLADRRPPAEAASPRPHRGPALREARPTLGGGMPFGGAAAAEPAPMMRRLWPGLQESSKKPAGPAPSDGDIAAIGGLLQDAAGRPCARQIPPHGAGCAEEPRPPASLPSPPLAGAAKIIYGWGRDAAA